MPTLPPVRNGSTGALRGAGSMLTGGGGQDGPGLNGSRSAASLAGGPPSASQSSRAAAAQCKERFREAAGTRSGTFDLSQFTAFLKKGNSEITDEECKQLFKKVDKGGSGLIEFDSFVDTVFVGSRPGSRDVGPSSRIGPVMASSGTPSGTGFAAAPDHNQMLLTPTAQPSAMGGGRKNSKAVRRGGRKRTFGVNMSRQSSREQQQVDKMVLSADCGGTTTRLMLYRVAPDAPVLRKQPAPGELLKEIKYPNIMFNSLKEIVKAFLTTDCGIPNARPIVAVFALAGVVVDGQCRFTNLDWIVNAKEMEQELKIPRVELINDFVAQGYGMLTLAEDETIPLTEGKPRPGAPIGCIGAGTGLGNCFLVPDATGEYRCFPSEAAHGEFAPRGAGSDELQLDMLRFLKVKLSGWNRISIERVVSGTGICNVYEFLAYKFPHDVDPLVHKEHQNNKNDAAVIVMNARPGTLCEKALQIFASSYGAAVGNMCLALQPFGGLYVTGGVTKRIQDWMLKDGSFMEAYRDKGRLSPICDQVPLLLVKGDDMGQRGAHLRAVRLLKEVLEEHAQRIFEEIDIYHEGWVTLEEVESRLYSSGMQPIAPAMKAHLAASSDDSDSYNFDQFFAAYCCLSEDLLAQLKDTAPEEEPVHNLSKSMLVRPPNRGNSEGARKELAELCKKYDELRAEYQNQPVFKMQLCIRKAGGNSQSAADWTEKEFWINQSGAFLYYDAEEKMTRIFCQGKDLVNAHIRELPSLPNSVKPWSFELRLRDHDGKLLEPTTFAATSAAARTLWMEQLESCTPKAK